MQSKDIGIMIVVLLVVGGGYFLLRGGYPAPTTKAPAAGVTEINVSGTEFSFSPANINVKAGQKAKLTFRNTGGASHNLIVEGLGVGTKTIGTGQTDTIEFEASASGTYAFFCSVPGHRASGMEGNLRVE